MGGRGEKVCREKGEKGREKVDKRGGREKGGGEEKRGREKGKGGGRRPLYPPFRIPT